LQQAAFVPTHAPGNGGGPVGGAGGAGLKVAVGSFTIFTKSGLMIYNNK